MSARSVWLDGARVSLAPAAMLGQGGEAEVYDLGDGRCVKWWKPPAHPDFDGLPDAQAAAGKRIAEAPGRLRAIAALAMRLPAAIVAPIGLALDAAGGAVCGYTMPRVSGTPLHSYGEPRWRRANPIAGAELVAMLLALRDALAGLHAAGIVVGDCNDLNVLVDGARVHLIDVDSYQLAGFPCAMFSERFVDPRLCDAATGLVPARPHDAGSDWFAFAAMALRTLLGVGPWGGVATGLGPTARALTRKSVLAANIAYPRAARPIAILPDEFLAQLRAVFERDERAPFPRDLLANLRLRACSACGEEHARPRCPACQAAAIAPPVVVRGNLRIQAIAPSEVALGTYEVGRHTAVYFDGAILYRRSSMRAGGWQAAQRPVGLEPTPERIGAILAGQTRAWCGAKLGVGFYRAAGYAVGFIFSPDRGPLDDRVALPRLRGQLVDAHAVVGDDRAWLFLTTAEAGRLVTTGIVIGADARVLATDVLVDASWLAGIAGACAAGPNLFVPTDDGVVRIEALAQTRRFAETGPHVGSGDRLALHATGIDAIRPRDAIRMHLS